MVVGLQCFQHSLLPRWRNDHDGSVFRKIWEKHIEALEGVNEETNFEELFKSWVLFLGSDLEDFPVDIQATSEPDRNDHHWLLTLPSDWICLAGFILPSCSRLARIRIPPRLISAGYVILMLSSLCPLVHDGERALLRLQLNRDFSDGRINAFEEMLLLQQLENMMWRILALGHRATLT